MHGLLRSKGWLRVNLTPDVIQEICRISLVFKEDDGREFVDSQYRWVELPIFWTSNKHLEPGKVFVRKSSFVLSLKEFGLSIETGVAQSIEGEILLSILASNLSDDVLLRALRDFNFAEVADESINVGIGCAVLDWLQSGARPVVDLKLSTTLSDLAELPIWPLEGERAGNLSDAFLPLPGERDFAGMKIVDTARMSPLQLETFSRMFNHIEHVSEARFIEVLGRSSAISTTVGENAALLARLSRFSFDEKTENVLRDAIFAFDQNGGLRPLAKLVEDLQGAENWLKDLDCYPINQSYRDEIDGGALQLLRRLGLPLGPGPDIILKGMFDVEISLRPSDLDRDATWFWQAMRVVSMSLQTQPLQDFTLLTGLDFPTSTGGWDLPERLYSPHCMHIGGTTIDYIEVPNEGDFDNVLSLLPLKYEVPLHKAIENLSAITESGQRPHSRLIQHLALACVANPDSADKTLSEIRTINPLAAITQRDGLKYFLDDLFIDAQEFEPLFRSATPRDKDSWNFVGLASRPAEEHIAHKLNLVIQELRSAGTPESAPGQFAQYLVGLRSLSADQVQSFVRSRVIEDAWVLAADGQFRNPKSLRRATSIVPAWPKLVSEWIEGLDSVNVHPAVRDIPCIADSIRSFNTTLVRELQNEPDDLGPLTDPPELILQDFSDVIVRLLEPSNPSEASSIRNALSGTYICTCSELSIEWVLPIENRRTLRFTQNNAFSYADWASDKPGLYVVASLAREKVLDTLISEVETLINGFNLEFTRDKRSMLDLLIRGGAADAREHLNRNLYANIESLLEFPPGIPPWSDDDDDDHDGDQNGVAIVEETQIVGGVNSAPVAPCEATGERENGDLNSGDKSPSNLNVEVVTGIETTIENSQRQPNQDAISRQARNLPELKRSSEIVETNDDTPRSIAVEGQHRESTQGRARNVANRSGRSPLTADTLGPSRSFRSGSVTARAAYPGVAEAKKRVEQKAVQFAIQFENSQGRNVKDMNDIETNHQGFDLRSEGEMGDIRNIEVKGISRMWPESRVIVSGAQLEESLRDENWWLYVVDNLDNSKENWRLFAFHRPFQAMAEFVLDYSWTSRRTEYFAEPQRVLEISVGDDVGFDYRGTFTRGRVQQIKVHGDFQIEYVVVTQEGDEVSARRQWLTIFGSSNS